MQRKCILFSTLILSFFLNSATLALGTATYKITSKWSNGAYINIAYSGAESWKAFVTYTLPMGVDNAVNGTASASGNTITFTPTSGTSLPLGAQISGNGDADPTLSYVLVQGQKIPFTGMPVPPKPAFDVYYLNPATYLPTGSIKIGQTEFPNVWLSGPFDVEFPKERKLWAMALAHASQLFKNVTRVQNGFVGPNHYVATVIQESRFGADPATATFTYPVAIQYPMIYQANTQTDGFFQIEGAGGGSAFGDLKILYPNRLGKLDHDAVVGGSRFSTSAITSAYYNIYMYTFLIGQGFNPGDFFSKAKDPQALDRVMALVYNRGAYSADVEKVFTTRRTYCLSLNNMADAAGKCLPNSGDYGSLYVRQVPGYNLVLMQAANSGQRGFPGLYSDRLSWGDINAYIDSVAMLYSAADIAKAKTAAKAQFDTLTTSGVIDFAAQFGSVLDKIMLALPVDSPVNILCNYFGLCHKEG